MDKTNQIEVVADVDHKISHLGAVERLDGAHAQEYAAALELAQVHPDPRGQLLDEANVGDRPLANARHASRSRVVHGERRQFRGAAEELGERGEEGGERGVAWAWVCDFERDKGGEAGRGAGVEGWIDVGRLEREVLEVDCRKESQQWRARELRATGEREVVESAVRQRRVACFKDLVVDHIALARKDGELLEAVTGLGLVGEDRGKVRGDVTVGQNQREGS